MSVAENTTQILDSPVENLPAPVSIAADPTKEYIAQEARMGIWGKMLQSLSWAIDDPSRDFGDDIWNRMSFDPIVSATLTILMASILEDGIRTAPAITDPKDPRSELSSYINSRAKLMLSRMKTRLSEVAWDMLTGCYLGNRVGEIVSKYVEEDGRLFLDIDYIKVKPRHSVAFVVDVYGNVHGLSSTINMKKKFTISKNDTFIDPKDPSILPRDKFWVYSFRPKEGNPLGTSVLRPAFSSWVDKIQTLAERQKHLARYGSPTLIGTVGKDAVPVQILDAVTNLPIPGRTISPLAALYAGLLTVHNGVVMAAPYDTKVDVIEAKGEGGVFDNALTYDNHQIVKTVLTQTLATEDAPHQARAAAQVHQGSIDTIVKQCKQAFAGSFRDDVLLHWVRRNWGEGAIDLVPLVSLGVTEAPDLARMMTAVASLFTVGFFSKSQIPTLDELLNLNARLPEELESLKVEGKAADTASKSLDSPSTGAKGPQNEG
jgi:hypothetical protein